MNQSQALTPRWRWLWGIIVGLAVAEVVLRLKTYQEINLAWNCYEPDLKMYLVYKRDSSCPYRRFKEYDTLPRINNLGLRSDSHTTLTKPQGVKRVLVLGDSLVAAHEVEERQTFVKLLENRFREIDKPVEILNGGIRGSSPFLEYFYLKFRALEFEPDVVIVVMNTADIADDRRYRRYGKVNQTTGEIESVWPNWNFYLSQQATASAQVDSHPEFKAWPQKIWQGLGKLKTVQIVLKNLRAWVNHWLGFELMQTQLIEGDWLTDPLAVEREQMVRDDYQTLLNQTKDNLVKIYNLVKGTGAEFYLVTTPMGHEVSATEWDLGRGGWGAKRGQVYPTRALDDIETWARDVEIKVVDMSVYLKEGEGLNFFPKDGHLTPLGHERFAEGLWVHLADEL